MILELCSIEIPASNNACQMYISMMRILLFVVISLLPSGCLYGLVLPEVWITGQGKHFRVDLYETGKGSRVRISIDEKGQILISATGSAKVSISDMLGPSYGKTEAIGEVEVEYYYDTRRSGKISRIGEIEIDYYDPYSGYSYAGKVKQVGDYLVEYFPEMDGPSKSGKISRLGNHTFDYYYSGDQAGKNIYDQ